MKSFCGLILSSSFLILGVIGCGTSNLNSDPQTMSASEVESEEDSTALIALSPEEALQKNSKEFQGRVRFVDINYKICLGRAPDRAGLIQWVNACRTCKPRYVRVSRRSLLRPTEKFSHAIPMLKVDDTGSLH
jgi:hypothetical protein